MTQLIGTFSESGARDPLAPFLKLVPTSLLNLEMSLPCCLRVAWYAAMLKTLFLMTEPGWLATASRFDDLLQYFHLPRVDLGFVPNVFSWFLVGIGLVVSFKRHVQLFIKQTSTTVFLIAWELTSCTARHLLWVTHQMKGTPMRQRSGCKGRRTTKTAGASVSTNRERGLAGVKVAKTLGTQCVVVIIIVLIGRSWLEGAGE